MVNLNKLRLIFMLGAVLMLAATGCSDDEDDPVADTGGTGDVVEDATPDTTADTTSDASEDTGVSDVTPDVVEEVIENLDLCLGTEDTALLTDEFKSIVGDAVGTCATASCLACASNPDNCGCPDDLPEAECNLSYCVVQCITDYTDDDENIIAVRDSGLSGGCTGCYAGITQCILDNGCAFGPPGNCATASDTCDCRTCQCDEGCVDGFVSCSGLEAYETCPTPEICEE